MADQELAQPDIEIVYEVRTQTVPIFSPTLPCCVFGVCRQVVEVLQTASSGQVLNDDALLDSPAFFDVTGTSFNLDNLHLGLSVNNSPVVSVAFAGVSVSPKYVADTINSALQDAQLWAYALAEVVYDSSGDATGLRMRTRNTGEQQSIQVSAPAVGDRAALAALALAEDHIFRGAGLYKQRVVAIPPFGYPDPRGNLGEVVIEPDNSRAFLYLGTGAALQEAYKTQAMLRAGIKSDVGNDLTNIAPLDDSDSDATTPIVRFSGEDFTAEGAAIVVTGTADLALLVLPDNLADKTITIDDGSGEQTLTFRSTTNYASAVTQFNAVWGAAVGGRLIASAYDAGAGAFNFRITTLDKGADAYLKIVAGGSALSVLGLTALEKRADRKLAAGTPVLAPYKPLAGDDLYINGLYAGRIIQVAPGGVVTDLKLDRELPVVVPAGTTWTSYFIVGRNLPGAPGVVRPDPDLVVDDDGTAHIKHSLIRDIQGTATAAQLPVYMAYTGIRQDVTAKATNAELLSFSSDDDITTLIEPKSAANPLALALHFAMLNSAGASVNGLGVDAVSDDQPYGTSDAFVRALGMLEAKLAYVLVPLTDDFEVAQLGLVHVTEMGQPEAKAERIILYTPAQPTHAMDTLATSGVNGNTDGATPKGFDTGIANLASLVQAAGVDPIGTIAVDSGLYLDIEGDAKHYSIKTITGSMLVLRYQAIEFAAGENDDAFYAEAQLPQCIQTAFAIKVRGAELVDTNGDPDKDAIANTYRDMAKSFAHRRFWMVTCSGVETTIDGLAQALPGFYYNAGYGAAISANPPQQSFTNFPILGFTNVRGTTGYFKTAQMNRMAGGGCTIPVKVGAVIQARQALTTDMSSEETFIDNIVKELDYLGYLTRNTLRTFIGRFNITQNFIDTLSSLLEGIRLFAIKAKAITNVEFGSLTQTAGSKSSLSVRATVTPTYPCNKITVTYVV